MSQAPSIAPPVCSREGCLLPQGGPCLEGHEPARCPNVSSTQTSTDAEATPPTEDAQKEVAAVVLPDGRALTSAAALDITRARRSTVIVLAGEAESGKTTLLVSLYQCFQHGPFAGYDFAGSRTLIGLEERCHYSRIASGRAVADTERTFLGRPEHLVHLRLRRRQDADPERDLLMTDLAGETFRRIRDDTSECKAVPLLSRADRLAVVLDGEKLASLRHRQTALADARQLLRSCIESQVLPASASIDIVVTKWDLIAVSGANAEEFAAEAGERVGEVIGERQAATPFVRTAARSSRPNETPTGLGLDELIQRWMVEPAPWVAKSLARNRPIDPQRAIDHFGLQSTHEGAEGRTP